MKKLHLLLSKSSSTLCLYLLAIVFIPCTLFLSLFYFFLKDTFNTQIRQSDLNLVEQMNMNIEYEIAPIYNNLLSFSMNESLHLALKNNDLRSKDSELYLTFNHLDDITHTIFNHSFDLYGLVVEPLNGGTLYFNNNNNFILNNLLWRCWKLDTLRLNGQVNWIGSYTYEEINNLFVVSKLIVNPLTMEPLGIVYLALYDYSLSSSLKMLEDPYSTTYILDNNNHIIFRNNTHISLDTRKIDISSLIPKASQGITETTYEGIDYTLTYSHLNNYNLRVLKIHPSTAYTHQLSVMTFIFLSILFVIFVLFVMYIIYFYKKLVWPLNKITNFFTTEHANPSFLYDLNTFKSYEFSSIGNGILSLVKENALEKTKINDLCKDKDLILLEKLQSQINPHFLYNTLTSIKYLSLNNETKQIAPVITSLIKLLRSCTNRDGIFITVSEELSHLKHYMTIQNVVYNNNISFIFDIHPYTMNLLAPNFILQPLVENAIFHGIDPNKNTGEIIVKTYLLDNKLIFEVKDNGKGFTPLAHETIKNSEGTPTKFSSIGISGTAEKIKLLCGNSYGLQILSTPNIGTTIQILLPIMTSDEVFKDDKSLVSR